MQHSWGKSHAANINSLQKSSWAAPLGTCTGTTLVTWVALACDSAWTDMVTMGRTLHPLGWVLTSCVQKPPNMPVFN